MDLAVDQLMLQYLADVGTVAQKHLPPRRRADYIQEVRSRIEAERAKANITTAAQMKRLLAQYGDASELVARDLSRSDGEDEDEPRQSMTAPRRMVGILARPVPYKLSPPPWEGGPRRTRLIRRKGVKIAPPDDVLPGKAPVEGLLGRFSPGVVLVRCVHGARNYPLAAASIAVYFAAGIFVQALAVWPLAAAHIAFSSAWRRADKWVALAVPLAATAVGMALWPGEERYIDHYLESSFRDTGILALRIAAFGCAFYLAASMSRLVAARRMRAGHYPLTGDTPVPTRGQSSEKKD